MNFFHPLLCAFFVFFATASARCCGKEADKNPVLTANKAEPPKPAEMKTPLSQDSSQAVKEFHDLREKILQVIAKAQDGDIIVNDMLNELTQLQDEHSKFIQRRGKELESVLNEETIKDFKIMNLYVTNIIEAFTFAQNQKLKTIKLLDFLQTEIRRINGMLQSAKNDKNVENEEYWKDQSGIVRRFFVGIQKYKDEWLLMQKSRAQTQDQQK